MHPSYGSSVWTFDAPRNVTSLSTMCGEALLGGATVFWGNLDFVGLAPALGNVGGPRRVYSSPLFIVNAINVHARHVIVVVVHTTAQPLGDLRGQIRSEAEAEH